MLLNSKIISLCLLLASTLVEGLEIPQKTAAPVASNSQDESSSKNSQNLSSTSKGNPSNSTSANASTITSNDYTNAPALYWASFAAIEKGFYSLTSLSGTLDGIDDLLQYQSSYNYTTCQLVVHSTDETMFSLYKSFYSGLPSVLKEVIDSDVDNRYTEFNGYDEYVVPANVVPVAPVTSDLFNYCLCLNLITSMATVDYRYQVFFETFTNTSLLSSAKDFFYAHPTQARLPPMTECLESFNPLSLVLPWASELNSGVTELVNTYMAYDTYSFPLNQSWYPMSSSSYALTSTVSGSPIVEYTFYPFEISHNFTVVLDGITETSLNLKSIETFTNQKTNKVTATASKTIYDTGSFTVTHVWVPTLSVTTDIQLLVTCAAEALLSQYHESPSAFDDFVTSNGNSSDVARFTSSFQDSNYFSNGYNITTEFDNLMFSYYRLFFSLPIEQKYPLIDSVGRCYLDGLAFGANSTTEGDDIMNEMFSQLFRVGDGLNYLSFGENVDGSSSKPFESTISNTGIFKINTITPVILPTAAQYESSDHAGHCYSLTQYVQT
ncbi:unnamed protein product [Ambrosiozyma monospora]|uniref:Unnamed protein product n=2 Tax=Ambrosiozyma monospora TaxID=43982 RepID=A0A9W6Z819_AMBMO|nr:unnamed protein product [Ambrosiozyma monospora]